MLCHVITRREAQGCMHGLHVDHFCITTPATMCPETPDTAMGFPAL
jgi:hypothetical protein